MGYNETNLYNEFAASGGACNPADESNAVSRDHHAL